MAGTVRQWRAVSGEPAWRDGGHRPVVGVYRGGGGVCVGVQWVHICGKIMPTIEQRTTMRISHDGECNVMD